MSENIKSNITYTFLEGKVIDDYNVKLLKKENQHLNIREPFISSDDTENYDINNFKWKKSIKDKVKDRYALLKRWQTSFEPNPNQNLSCYNWRKKNALPRPRNNQEHVLPDESSTSHLNEIYYKKSELLLKKFKKIHFDNLSRRTGDQSSVPSSSSSSLIASEKEIKVIYQEKIQIMKNARNEIHKILTYYSGYLTSINKNGSTNPENVFYLKNAEVKKWFEREEIMDRRDDFNI
ncbi:hypothetical protein O3M35_001009 [Rhynocoris fuscipes]|uniref:Uncharacterized protein n=1 Tax=Rhynocoris fuscipes TaxID=488301 RepID=A0AAW1DSQ3_9HEMI